MQTPGNYRHTKIVVTLGPVTESRDRIEQLISASVDILRLNMAHATQDWVTEIVERIRDVSNQLGRHVAVMMDIKGSEIRTGDVDGLINLSVGSHIVFCTGPSQPYGDEVPSVTVNYRDLPGEVEVGQIVLVDSGLLRLRVVAKDETRIRCEVMTAGKLGSRRHINLPGVHVNLPSLTEKDRIDLAAGVAAGIDLVALSFKRERNGQALFIRSQRIGHTQFKHVGFSTKRRE